MEYVALDFETANGRIDSICQIGAVTFSDGKIISKYEKLIRPQPFYFEPMNIQIHGIDANMVKDMPTFAEVYEDFFAYINHKKIICHNAGFDMSVLHKIILKNDLIFPDITYECSLTLARKFIKDEASYSLSKLVTSVLDFEFKHHDALEDAYACGLLYQHLIDNYEVNSYVESEYRIGHYENSEHITFRKKNYQPKIKNKVKAEDIKQIDNLLKGKSFCFTGKMEKTRRILEELILSHGGMIAEFIDKRTTYVVTGAFRQKDGVSMISSKYKQAQKLKESGGAVKILNEQEFWAMMEQLLNYNIEE